MKDPGKAYDKFTFQYGYSKTRHSTSTQAPYLHLHSSMVIVKRKMFTGIQPLVNVFTFQYGYSKTGKREVITRDYYAFTFQYGYSKTQ